MKSQDDRNTGDDSRLIHGYEQVLQRVEQTLASATERSEDALKQALDAARDKAVELGELSREEADKVTEFISRDLHDVGQYLAMEERELADWLHLSLLVVEKKLLNRFTTLAHAAKLELKHFEKAKLRLSEWHTGEVTSIGTLSCQSCGEMIHFNRIGHIPPCPKCHATLYRRARS